MSTYTKGTIVEVVSHITANHLGEIQYHLCKINDSSKPEPGEDCFELLKFQDGSVDQKINEWDYVVHSQLQLPKDVTCEHCVLRWTYNTGE